MLRTITTCHKAGFDQYGHKCLAGLKHWPGKVWWYAEGHDLPDSKPANVKALRNEVLPKLAEFKAKWAFYQPPDWRYDVVRFANKVYAVHDGLRGHDGLGIWMDADIVTMEDLPQAYLESLLPDGCYIALFQREGMHSECGLWLVDCTHPQHKRFMDTLLAWYEKGTFRDAHEWHDSVLMDATIRAFTRDRLIEVHNLSGKWSKESHPMAFSPISRYIDHLKGPNRKDLGRSPERKVA